MDRSINTSKMELSIIEYPGLVKNVENMLETLGGIFKVSQVVCGEAKRLELRYHSRNPFNKAIPGEIVSRTGLLISVKIHKLNGKYHLPVFRTEIIGYCNNCLLFESLCDFQYLPLTKSSTSECVEHMLDYLTPSVVTDTSHFSKPFGCFFCIPHIFARSDTSKSNIFRNIAQDDGQDAILGVLQTCTYNSRDVVAFSMMESIPLRPDNQVVKRMKIKYVSDEQLERVKKLFDACPIWTRIALLYESGVSNDKLKCIIPSLAFYYSTGPWRTLYVRYGYDPRKDFDSRYYQTFDFRLRFRSGVAELVEKRREANLRKKGRHTEANCIVQDINYPYLDENKLPRSRQCILRYCDIRMCKIQAMLDKIPTPMNGAKCNERTGWLPVGFDGQIRQVLSNIIKDVMRKHCRK